MKITRVIDREFKTGEKNGKRWTMVKVEVEGGKEATGFGNVVEGDEVDLTYNEKYNNYSFKLLGPQDIPSRDINEDVPKSVGTSSVAPSYKAEPSKDKAYLKDASTVPLDVYRVRANIDGLPNDTSTRKTFFKNVQEDAVILLQMIDDVRNDKLVSATPKKKGIELAREKADEIRGIEPLGEEDVPSDLFDE